MLKPTHSTRIIMLKPRIIMLKPTHSPRETGSIVMKADPLSEMPSSTL